MPGQKPSGTHPLSVDGLGEVTGYEYANGVRQYCGIPYATLAKRWTRSQLCTRWGGGRHDGTKLGANCPNPFEAEGDSDLTPVPPFPVFDQPVTDERNALVTNIVVPPTTTAGSDVVPVMVYVHGGSLLFGGANLAIFDAVNLVSTSVRLGKPIVVVNFNYRVGLGGFLASKAIESELAEDGYSGCGNFGLTDQQTAFEWVQKYIGSFGGDVSQVTAVGESAGGISISHQLLAKRPSTFARAICMSGLSCSIPSWTIDEHDKLFAAVCRHFSIDPTSPDALESLRKIPEQRLAGETAAIQGVPSGTGNPCLDGSFHQADPNRPQPCPSWLKSYMVGDTYHEGVIFHFNILDDTFDSIRSTLLEHVSDPASVDQVLDWYNVRSSSSQDELMQRFEHMAGDFVFKIPNYSTLQANKLLEHDALFGYHFDQRSRLKNPLEGTAYHAHELLYLFRNLDEEMNDQEIHFSEKFSQAWIRFVHGDRPWEAGGGDRWMRWGQDCAMEVVDEEADETVRGYRRMRQVLHAGESGETWLQILRGVDSIVNKRTRMGGAPPLVL